MPGGPNRFDANPALAAMNGSLPADGPASAAGADGIGRRTAFRMWPVSPPHAQLYPELCADHIRRPWSAR